MSLKAVSGAAAGSTSPLPSTVVVRDANGNAFANNFVVSSTSTVTSASPIVLTAASSAIQVLTGSTAQTITLPDARTLTASQWFTINNNSSATATVNNNGGSQVVQVPAGGFIALFTTDVSTANGVWDGHPLAPITAQWGSGTTGLVMNSALTTTPMITAAVASATNPVFLPQRGASTTGIGGTSTTVNTVVDGASIVEASATGIKILAGSILTGYVESTWTPADASGAGLSLTVTSATYTRIGRMVAISANVAYPATGSGAAAQWSGLPVAVASLGTSGVNSSSATTPIVARAIAGGSNIDFNTGSASVTNANLSGKVVQFSLVYFA